MSLYYLKKGLENEKRNIKYSIFYCKKWKNKIKHWTNKENSLYQHEY